MTKEKLIQNAAGIVKYLGIPGFSSGTAEGRFGETDGDRQREG
jgi:hypothetical protein